MDEQGLPPRLPGEAASAESAFPKILVELAELREAYAPLPLLLCCLEDVSKTWRHRTMLGEWDQPKGREGGSGAWPSWCRSVSLRTSSRVGRQAGNCSQPSPQVTLSGSFSAHQQHIWSDTYASSSAASMTAVIGSWRSSATL